MKFTTLIDGHTLAKHVDDPAWVVVDCRFTLTSPGAGRAAYWAGHIPGAVYAHLDDDLSSPQGPLTGRHPLPNPNALAAKLGEWGIDNTKQVVVYDDAFGAIAARLWWLLRWLGHDAVALLDGGFPVWQRQRLPATPVRPVVRPATFKTKLRNERWVDAAFVEKSLATNSAVVLDVRSEERFNGEVEPLDKVAGHIPGSRSAPYEDNLDMGGTFLSSDALAEHYRALLGNRSASEAVVMCGSGVTACHSLLAMEHAGLPGAKLYAGSWSEWITDTKRPVATGP
jgi:thiosulfate/3-mercaptopyruvate sulfurtransferase